MGGSKSTIWGKGDLGPLADVHVCIAIILSVS